MLGVWGRQEASSQQLSRRNLSVNQFTGDGKIPLEVGPKFLNPFALSVLMRLYFLEEVVSRILVPLDSVPDRGI